MPGTWTLYMDCDHGTCNTRDCLRGGGSLWVMDNLMDFIVWINWWGQRKEKRKAREGVWTESRETVGNKKKPWKGSRKEIASRKCYNKMRELWRRGSQSRRTPQVESPAPTTIAIVIGQQVTDYLGTNVCWEELIGMKGKFRLVRSKWPDQRSRKGWRP